MVSLLVDLVSLVSWSIARPDLSHFQILFGQTNDLIVLIILSSDWSTDCPIICVSG